jgi:hypothetical protein
LFGKALRGVDVRGVAGSFSGFTAGAAGSAAAIANAAKAQENLERVIGDLKVAILTTIGPITEFVAKLNTAGETTRRVIGAVGEFVKTFATVAIVVASVVASFTLVGRVITLLRAGFTTLVTVGQSLVGLVRALFNPTIFANIVKELGSLGSVGRGLQGFFQALAGTFNLTAKNIALFSAGVAGAVAALKEFFDVNNNAGTDKAIAIIEAEKAALIKRREEIENNTKKLREVTAANEEKIKSIREGTAEYARQVKQIGIQISRETDLIGKSKEYADLIRAQAEAADRASGEIEKLRKAKELLKQEDKEANVGLEYDRQIAEVKRLADAEQLRLTGLIESLNAAERANQFRLFTLQEEYRLTDQLRDIQDELARSTMSEIERKYYDIDVAARKSAESAIRAEEARIGRRLNTDEAKEYYNASINGAEELKEKQDELYESSRRFSTGFKKAFQEYADNATNAARTAERIFAKATQGMEDAIVGFAKTGKFEFKNFVNMMLEELLRAQIQQTFAKILGGMTGAMGGRGGGGGGGGGGLLGGLGSLFGGLFGGGGGSPQGGGAPRQQSGGGLFGGISKLFSGFFANGGSIPQGRFGIVGERGPEFVGGPATVTPMTGTQVTYNINAVDAASFKALVARDPGFIYAVTMQGAKSMPGAR